MAFSHRNKELLGGGTSFTIYGYRTEDTMAQVLEEGYFRNWSELKPGNWIFLHCGDGTFMAIVRYIGPVVLGPPDFPFAGDENINDLRARCKEKGINSFGKSKEELARALAAA